MNDKVTGRHGSLLETNSIPSPQLDARLMFGVNPYTDNNLRDVQTTSFAGTSYFIVLYFFLLRR